MDIQEKCKDAIGLLTACLLNHLQNDMTAHNKFNYELKTAHGTDAKLLKIKRLAARNNILNVIKILVQHTNIIVAYQWHVDVYVEGFGERQLKEIAGVAVDMINHNSEDDEQTRNLYLAEYDNSTWFAITHDAYKDFGSYLNAILKHIFVVQGHLDRCDNNPCTGFGTHETADHTILKILFKAFVLLFSSFYHVCEHKEVFDACDFTRESLEGLYQSATEHAKKIRNYDSNQTADA